ncbi:hypothetical protein DPEC_G00206830 [Dallia pectoralis]|uniref:Uncharacterized protein n=1 Tax=Dallia pectoralis TaxID=75939 RepID=A0ACC2G527_DALPE|nr:hypothetical protein DPEC_G00206830 [Dallia pectoralis]
MGDQGRIGNGRRKPAGGQCSAFPLAQMEHDAAYSWVSTSMVGHQNRLRRMDGVRARPTTDSISHVKAATILVGGRRGSVVRGNSSNEKTRDRASGLLNAALYILVSCALLGFSATRTSLPQGYLWVASGGGANQYLNRPIPRPVKSLQIGSPVKCLEYVPESRHSEGVEVDAGTLKSQFGVGNIICLGLDDGRS